ncbi:MAG: hypothetical protein M1375_04915 [Candidatus Thermoplasmatota archaeon]|nr:hypothetical protein [Candidatus Thermoplasmatota archaeon]MCL5791294.1 hypothetical protein [Candidatus Thermoplasmatota archaeon]
MKIREKGDIPYYLRWLKERRNAYRVNAGIGLAFFLVTAIFVISRDLKSPAAALFGYLAIILLGITIADSILVEMKYHKAINR